MKKKIFVLMLVMILVITGLSAQTYTKVDYLDAPFYGMYDDKVVVDYFKSENSAHFIINTKMNLDYKTENTFNKYFKKAWELDFSDGVTVIKWSATPENFYKFMKKEGKNFYLVERNPKY